MQAIATEGGGHFYFIEQPEQIPDLLTSELGETLDVVARDIELFVGVPEGARAKLLHAYPSAQETRGVHCRLGNLVSGQQSAALFSVTFPRGEDGSEAALDVTLTDQANVLGSPSRSFAMRYTSNQENDRQPRDIDVARAVAEIYAERARREALEVNHSGDFLEAMHVLNKAAERIRQYAGNDSAMLKTVERILKDENEFSRKMDMMSTKRHYYSSEWFLKSRGADGKARRM